MQFLDASKVKPSNVHRFVENYVSGKYIQMKKEYDPNEAIQLGEADADGDGIVST